MAKKIVKTVNRTGKSLVKKALVVKGKKSVDLDAEKIKKLNEEKLAAKAKLARTEETEEVENKKVERVKEDKKYNLTVDLKDLLDNGVHLGHKISKTHPKARDFIYTAKDGIEIIDLTKTFAQLEKACTYIYNARRNGKQVLLVGTKRQAKEVVKRIALEAGVPYVTDRWLGGTISNWEQVSKSVKKLAQLKEGIEKGTFAELTKKEQADIKKEMARLDKIVGGLSNMEKLAEVMFVVDAGYERTAIKEADLRGIKTVAICDTDSNPRKVDFAIAANDDNVKSVNLLVEEVGKAIKAAGVK